MDQKIGMSKKERSKREIAVQGKEHSMTITCRARQSAHRNNLLLFGCCYCCNGTSGR